MHRIAIPEPAIEHCAACAACSVAVASPAYSVLLAGYHQYQQISHPGVNGWHVKYYHHHQYRGIAYL